MNFRNLLLACALGGAVAGATLPAAAQSGWSESTFKTGAARAGFTKRPARLDPPLLGEVGYWSWNGYRYVWVHGRYSYPPYAGQTWHAGHWAHRDRGWVWVGGHWGRPY